MTIKFRQDCINFIAARPRKGAKFFYPNFCQCLRDWCHCNKDCAFFKPKSQKDVGAIISNKPVRLQTRINNDLRTSDDAKKEKAILKKYPSMLDYIIGHSVDLPDYSIDYDEADDL